VPKITEYNDLKNIQNMLIAFSSQPGGCALDGDKGKKSPLRTALINKVFNASQPCRPLCSLMADAFREMRNAKGHPDVIEKILTEFTLHISDTGANQGNSISAMPQTVGGGAPGAQTVGGGAPGAQTVGGGAPGAQNVGGGAPVGGQDLTEAAPAETSQIPMETSNQDEIGAATAQETTCNVGPTHTNEAWTVLNQPEAQRASLIQQSDCVTATWAETVDAHSSHVPNEKGTLARDNAVAAAQAQEQKRVRNTLDNGKVQEQIMQKILHSLGLDLQGEEPAVSRCRKLLRRLTSALYRGADQMTGADFRSFAPGSARLLGNTPQELEAGTDDYKLSPDQMLQSDTEAPPRGMARLELLADLFKVTEDGSGCQADNDTAQFPYESHTDWFAHVDIGLYSKGKTGNAASNVLHLDATMSMFVDSQGSVMYNDNFEKKDRQATEMSFQELGNMYCCKMQDEMGCIMDSEMESNMLIHALRGADVIQIKPLIELGTRTLESISRFCTLVKGHDSQPYMSLEQVYHSGSYVARLIATRFGAWLLYHLLRDFVKFRQKVYNMDFRMFVFEEVSLCVCLVDEGRSFRLTKMDNEARYVCIYVCTKMGNEDSFTCTCIYWCVSVTLCKYL
jgi:hypothetical protein